MALEFLSKKLEKELSDEDSLSKKYGGKKVATAIKKALRNLREAESFKVLQGMPQKHEKLTENLREFYSCRIHKLRLIYTIDTKKDSQVVKVIMIDNKHYEELKLWLKQQDTRQNR